MMGEVKQLNGCQLGRVEVTRSCRGIKLVVTASHSRQCHSPDAHPMYASTNMPEESSIHSPKIERENLLPRSHNQNSLVYDMGPYSGIYWRLYTLTKTLDPQPSTPNPKPQARGQGYAKAPMPYLDLPNTPKSNGAIYIYIYKHIYIYIYI